MKVLVMVLFHCKADCKCLGSKPSRRSETLGNAVYMYILDVGEKFLRKLNLSCE